MRNVILVSLCAIALCTPAAVMAAPGVSLTEPAQKMASSQFSDFKGSYQLSTGEVLRISDANRKFYADIDGRAKVEIVPVGPSTFVGKDSALRIEFQQFANGNVPSLRLAMAKQ